MQHFGIGTAVTKVRPKPLPLLEVKPIFEEVLKAFNSGSKPCCVTRALQ
jgi:hypothetical protein